MKHLLWAILFSLAGAPAMAQGEKANLLVLIHSDTGGTYALAKEIAAGITSDGKASATIKQVKASTNPTLRHLPVASVEELPRYDGIAFGSPVYFGNLSTGMSEFLAKTTGLWSRHALEGMPATVFMSAGSGAGNELAVQAFWNSLAVHGMVLVPNGIRGTEAIDKTIPQGNTVLGATSLASLTQVERPSKGERHIAYVQGQHFARVAAALKGTRPPAADAAPANAVAPARDLLKAKGIVLPPTPKPVGNYSAYVRSGNLVFINQVALKDGKILHPGRLGAQVSEPQAKEATRTTMLNVLAVLNDAVGGDLSRVRRAVQLTGIFNTAEGYSRHAELMNVASELTVELFGERGKHARATLGAASLPLHSPVEIQAVFEVE